MLSIEEIRSRDLWAEVREEWNALARQLPDNSPFLSHDWFDCCLHGFGEDKELNVLVARNGGEMIGGAPLWRFAMPLNGFTVRVLGFITVPDSPHVDFICGSRHRETVLAAFTDHIHGASREWDILFLDQWCIDSPNHVAFEQMVEQRTLRSFSLPYSTTPYLPIAGDWETFWRSRSSKFRKTRRNIRNRLHKSGAVELHCHRDDPKGEVLQKVMALSKESWKNEEGLALSDDPQAVRFFEALTDAATRNGWLRLWLLTIDGEPAAMEYDLEADGRVFALRADYSRRFRELSPGAFVEQQVVQSLFEGRASRYVSGPGASSYKLQWTELLSENDAVVVCGRSWRGRVAYLVEHARRRLRATKRFWTLRTWRALPGEWVFALKTRAMQAVARFLSITGGLRAITSVARRVSVGDENGGLAMPKQRRCARYVVLTFHRVSDEPHPYFGGLPVAVFRKQMNLLRRHFHVLPLEELVERADVDDVPPNAVAITFDDGYRDNYQYAYPVLEELGLPATIFLVTDAVECNAPIWHDRVFEAFRMTRAGFVALGGEELSIQSMSEKDEVLERVLSRLRTLDPADRDREIDLLLRKLRVCVAPDACLPKLSWSEVQTMHQGGIGFGAHTVRHPILSRMPIDAAAKEIRLSKEIIETRLGAPVNLFAYPNGKREDYNEELKDVLRDAGYTGAVTTVWGANDATTDPFELRRMSSVEADAELSMLRLGWFQLLS
jgi:peptidoglycan/xylan/chitin deacetylase (PgdA/CDA1 family)/CelD/BcsL family acetyltransferase involved in cellulose biosynthesis